MNKIERQAASDAARASVELEGFMVPGNTLEVADRYIEGSISFQTLISNLYRQAVKTCAEKDIILCR